MTYIVSITSQGQISIPAKIRKQLGLSKNGRAFVSVEDKKIIVEPVEDFLELKGSLKTNKRPLSNQELDDLVGEAVVEEYTQKLKRMK